ncbi:hypothetical protein B0J12DRAFT_267666 [Macrophomina phaseolina]|uniref:Uncharacterized protein n=1 Tax=Macrophomina phaseolina TaxID=35725 RepID=A0ABQ8FY46_9PEZI|nr:hypothetical protein B0J12DRAFT_267666 [Macrophomina phaseolina]
MQCGVFLWCSKAGGSGVMKAAGQERCANGRGSFADAQRSSTSRKARPSPSRHTHTHRELVAPARARKEWKGGPPQHRHARAAAQPAPLIPQALRREWLRRARVSLAFGRYRAGQGLPLSGVVEAAQTGQQTARSVTMRQARLCSGGPRCQLPRRYVIGVSFREINGPPPEVAAPQRTELRMAFLRSASRRACVTCGMSACRCSMRARAA